MTPTALTVLDRRGRANRRMPLVAATGVVFLTALGLPGVALADQATPTPAPATPAPAPQTPAPATPAPPANPQTPPEQPTTTATNPVLPPGTAIPDIPEVPQPSAKTPPTPLPTKTPDTTVTGVKGAMNPTTLFNGQIPGEALPGDPTAVVSLQDSIGIALLRTPEVLQAEETAYDTIKIVDQIEAIKKPQVSGTVNYSRLANAASSAFAGGVSPGSIDVPFSVGLTNTPPGSTPIALSTSTTSSGSTVSTATGSSTSSGSTTSPTTTASPAASGTSTTPAASISTSSGNPVAAVDTSSADRTAAITRQTTGTTGTGTTTPGGGSGNTSASPVSSGEGTDLNSFGAHITVSQLIDITGIVKVAEDYGHLQEAFSRLELARIRQQTVYNVRNSYYNLLRALAFDSVDEAAVADSQELLRVTIAQKNAGVASQYDVLNAQTELDTNKQALISARNQVALSKNAFANTLGLDPSTVVTPQAQPIPLMPNLDENGLLHTAFAQRPEYLESDINLLKAGANIRLSHRNLEPYLDAGITAGYDPLSDGFGGYHSTAGIGVVLTVPLYDGGATRAAIDQAKSDQRVAYVQKDEYVKGIKAEVQQSIIAINDANERNSTVTESVTDAREALRLANVRFKAGVGTQLDVTTAESNLVQAESNQVNAQFDFLGAIARLDLAVGTPQ